jgi:hypothetical protein
MILVLVTAQQVKLDDARNIPEMASRDRQSRSNASSSRGMT